MTTERGGAPGGGHVIERPWYGLDDSWMVGAACKNLDPIDRRDFFVDTSRLLVDRFAEARAKTFCLACPVRGECLDYAIAADMYGVWGGTSRAERQVIVKRRRTSPGVATVPPTATRDGR